MLNELFIIFLWNCRTFSDNVTKKRDIENEEVSLDCIFNLAAGGGTSAGRNHTQIKQTKQKESVSDSRK